MSRPSSLQKYLLPCFFAAVVLSGCGSHSRTGETGGTAIVVRPEEPPEIIRREEISRTCQFGKVSIPTIPDRARVSVSLTWEIKEGVYRYVGQERKLLTVDASTPTYADRRVDLVAEYQGNKFSKSVTTDGGGEAIFDLDPADMERAFREMGAKDQLALTVVTQDGCQRQYALSFQQVQGIYLRVR